MNVDNGDAKKAGTVKAETRTQNTMEMEVPTYNAIFAVAPVGYRKLNVANARHNKNKMIALKMLTLIDEVLYHTSKTATQSAQGTVRTIVYDIVEQVLLDRITQDS